MTSQLWIDLFCGAGGTTTGIEQARHQGHKFAKVVACVNHDPKAIASHAANHPEALHYEEDIRTVDLGAMRSALLRAQAEHPEAITCLWASLECTNFSNAKGGQPRNADSRTLAEHLFRYIEGLQPDRIYIENVREFMAWGPLNEQGKPVSRTKGRDYVRWVQAIEAMGYFYDYRVLNAADFGAYTSRQRYFGQFVRHRMPICWPEPTNTKSPRKGSLFGDLKPWKPVREVLNLGSVGQSIFERKQALAPKTLARILAGLRKFVPNQDGFCMASNGGQESGKVWGLDSPGRTVTAQPNHALVFPWIAGYYTDQQERVRSVNEPMSTVPTQARHYTCFARRAVQWLDKAYSTESHTLPLDQPCGTVTVKDHHFLVTVRGKSLAQSGDRPAPTQTTSGKHHYLINPAYLGSIKDVSEPCRVVVARQDKAPLSLVSVEKGIHPACWVDRAEDSPEMAQIRAFCRANGIADITMRMLEVAELVRIQGFPEDYQFVGSQTEVKKFLGNAVIPQVAEALALACHVGQVERRAVA